MTLDLRDDLPAEVGHILAGKTVRRIFSQEHVPDILECLSGKLTRAKDKTDQKAFDVVIFGIIPVEIGMILAANLVSWDDIESLWYAHPRGAECKIFPV